jgi:hypothetical protein
MGRRVAPTTTPAPEVVPETVSALLRGLRAALAPHGGTADAYRSAVLVSPTLPFGSSVLDSPLPGTGWRIWAALPPASTREAYNARADAVSAAVAGRVLRSNEDGPHLYETTQEV